MTNTETGLVFSEGEVSTDEKKEDNQSVSTATEKTEFSSFGLAMDSLLRWGFDSCG